MKKITILALHLGYGGIEKCISSFCNILDSDYEIEIISTYKLYDKVPFEISDRVKIKYLIDDDIAIRVNVYKNYLKNFKLISLTKSLWCDYLSRFRIVSLFKDTFNSIKTLKKKKKLMLKEVKECKSDIILSTRFEYNNYLNKVKKKDIVKIGWEHNHHHGDPNYAANVIEGAKNLDYLVLVSNSLKEFYEGKLKNTKCKCVYIPNMIDEIYTPAKLENNRIVSVGRLSKEKGFSDLVDVFSLVHEKYEDWVLDIIGDGPEREKIENKIKNKKLDGVIHLCGFRNRDYINDKLSKSSIYVMTSHTESFGIVLLEGMSWGIPLVAFDEAEGASELINSKNGYLIKNRDKEKMAESIIKLIENRKKRIELGSGGYKQVKKYLPKSVKKEWLKILK